MIFDAVDLIGSYTDFDLWGTIGIQLPNTIWRYIELGLDYVLMQLGSGSEEDAVE